MALRATKGDEDARHSGAGAPPADRRPRRSTGRRPAAVRVFNRAVSLKRLSTRCPRLQDGNAVAAVH
jgi:hypothetical protein